MVGGIRLYSYWRSSAAYRVRIEIVDAKGASLFGAIEQTVTRYEPHR